MRPKKRNKVIDKENQKGSQSRPQGTDDGERKARSVDCKGYNKETRL